MTAKELELFKLPSCKHVAFRNKVVIGFVVFQGLDTHILKHLTLEHLDFDKDKLHIPGTKTTEPKTYKLRDEQIPILRRYLQGDRPMPQKRLNNCSESLFPLNSDRFSVIDNQAIKVLKND